MRVIILDNKDTEKIVSYFVAYGFDSFIVFGEKDPKIDYEYFGLNGIEIIFIRDFSRVGTRDRILKIRGSLLDSFIIVYSKEACSFDLDMLKSRHRENQCVATLLQRDNRLCAVVCEREIMDYLNAGESFEREILQRIGQDSEISILE